jgi:histidine triad (HIT) family protein
VTRARGGPCVFCGVLEGGAPSEIVFEDTGHVVILDHRPLLPGHCLVLPRTHFETFPDMPPAAVGPLFQVVQRIAGAMEKGLDAGGSFVAINNRISQSVPHVHVHVVPRREKDGLFARGLVWKRQPYPDQATMAEVAARIRGAL